MASFLDLPGELRNPIYVSLLTADDNLKRDDIATYLAPPTCAEASPSRDSVQNVAIKSQLRQRKDGRVAFLGACRLINREATPLLYKLRPLRLSLRPKSYTSEPTLVKVFELTFASLPRSYLLNCGCLSQNLRSVQNVELSLATAPQAQSITDMRLDLSPLKDLHNPNSCHVKLYYDMSSAWHGGTTTMLKQLLGEGSREGLEVFSSLTFSTKLLNMSPTGWSACAEEFAEPDIDAPDEFIMNDVERTMPPRYGEATEWDEVVVGEAARRITFYPHKYRAS